MAKRKISREQPTTLHERQNDPEILSLEECRHYLRKYHLSDHAIVTIRNNLIGMVESIVSLYLHEEHTSWKEHIEKH